MKTIAITRIDGGVSILKTTADVAVEVNKWAQSSDGFASYREISDAELPADMNADPFRNAWSDSGDRIVHDMSKAKEIHKNRLRVQRAPVLGALDVDFMRAVEANDVAKQATIAAKKQALRDITTDPRITSATSVSDLMAITLPT